MCPKCSTGLLMTERSYNLHEGGGYLILTRCVACGFYCDDVIEQNRRATGSTFPMFKAPNRRELARQGKEVLA
jgi:hypothetical protein